jgi:hypothetical protein
MEGEMTRRTRLVHVSGPNVVPFCGVTLRRRLSVAANPHPPKGQFGKLALRKQAVGTTQYRRRAAHQGMDFEDLQEHQQIA